MQEIEAVIVGAGQAGLAASHELQREGVEHVVLERERIGEGWRKRWDHFCLVTPNWSVQLPGFPYDRDDPDGFMPRDEIVAYLERYAESFASPVHEGVTIDSVSKIDGKFILQTNAGQYRTASLILATGAYQRPHRPAGADTFPGDLVPIDIGDYSNPDSLPDGAVLIIGSGQTGCQIAEELHEAGRRVVLSCGRAPWFPRRIADRDLFWWIAESGFLDAGVETLPGEARLAANILASGHGGGHDMHLRTIQALGVTLTGHFRGVTDKAAHFAADLAESVAWGDARYQQIKGLVQTVAKRDGLDVSDLKDPEPFDANAPEKIDLADFGTVILTGGFRPDYASWLPWPAAFDDHGFPLQKDGASTVVDGLHFIGLHLLRKRKSALLIGVGEDAGVVAKTVSGH